MPSNPRATEPAQLGALPLLDEAVIASLRDPELGGEPEFLAEVVEAFVGDTPQRIALLRASLAQDDAEMLARTAHSLKGSSGNFGAARMQTLCADIERLSRAEQVAALPGLIERLEIEYDHVARRLAAFVA